MLYKMELHNFINDNILTNIYNSKFKSVYKDYKHNTQISDKQKDRYIDILYAIDNVPPCFNCTRKNIKTKVDAYVKSIKETDYYKNEYFYKSGFKDGFNFLLELQKQERNDKTNE